MMKLHCSCLQEIGSCALVEGLLVDANFALRTSDSRWRQAQCLDWRKARQKRQKIQVPKSQALSRRLSSQQFSRRILQNHKFVESTPQQWPTISDERKLIRLRCYYYYLSLSTSYIAISLATDCFLPILTGLCLDRRSTCSPQSCARVSKLRKHISCLNGIET